VSRTVAIRRFERVSNIPLRCQGQPVGGHGRTGDVAAQALELATLVGLGGDPGVQREAGGLGQLAVVAIFFFPGGHGLQCKRLAPSLGADGDAVRLQGCRR